MSRSKHLPPSKTSVTQQSPKQPSFAQIAAEHAQLGSELSEEEKEILEETVSLDSTMLVGCSYDPETEEVELIFQNGDTANYPCDIPTYKGLLAAPSPGKYVWSTFF